LKIEKPIKALMVDVDGVLVDGRPDDGRHWQAGLEEDLGFSADALQEHFFTPYWEDIVVGRSGLMDPLTAALQKIAPHVSPADFLRYWFHSDSRVVAPLLAELALVRAEGILVYLATNQEHLRASYLMETLGLSQYVDGIFYSAQLGVKKPDLEFFTGIQAALDFPGDQIFLIDDSRANIEAARTAGWQARLWAGHSTAEILRALRSVN
jgi:putative hydrolase of the HAD superfamily